MSRTRGAVSPSTTKVFGVIGLIAVAALGWVVAVGPQTSTLAATREEVSAVRDSNAMLAGQLASLVKQERRLDETRATARRMAAKFPPTADQPGLFEQVTAAAVDAGIGAQGVTTLAPTPPSLGEGPAGASTTGATAPAAAAPGGLLGRQTVTVTVTGTYDQTQRLLTNLEHMRRAYLISSVALAGGADDTSYTTTITGDMFVMPPVKDPGTTATSTQSGSSDTEE